MNASWMLFYLSFFRLLFLYAFLYTRLFMRMRLCMYMLWYSRKCIPARTHPNVYICVNDDDGDFLFFSIPWSLTILHSFWNVSLLFLFRWKSTWYSKGETANFDSHSVPNVSSVSLSLPDSHLLKHIWQHYAISLCIIGATRTHSRKN